MSEEQIDWSRFLPTEEDDGEALALVPGMAVACKCGPWNFVARVLSVSCDDWRGQAVWFESLSGEAPLVADEDSRIVDNCRVIRNADGSWQPGYSASGPVAKPAEPALLAVPWQSCAERLPRVGDVWSHSHEQAKWKVLQLTARGMRVRCVAPGSDGRGLDEEYDIYLGDWTRGDLYVWTPREPDAKPELFAPIPDEAWAPAKPEPTAAEKRRAEWLASWNGGNNDELAVPGIVGLAARTDLPDMLGRTIVERNNPHLRPRWNNSPPYVSPRSKR